VRPVAGALALALLVASRPSLAGQIEPEIRWLSLGDWTRELEFSYEAETQERESKLFDSKSSVEYTSFRELLTLGTAGYAYHPRFLDFRGRFGFEVAQNDGSIDTGLERSSESRDGTSPRYNVSGIFFKEHPVSLAFGLNRYQTTVTRAFSDLAELSEESQTATLYYKDEMLPTRAVFFHSTSMRDELGRGEDRDEELTTFELVSEHDEDDFASRFGYEYQDSVEHYRPFGDESLESTYLRRTHRVTHNGTLRFGEERRSFFRSLATYDDTSGTSPMNRLSVDHLLHLQHRKNLSTHYALDYARETVGESTTDRAQVRAGLNHQLYESLQTFVLARGETEQINDFSRDLVGLATDFDYRKRIPHGLLSAHLGGGYSVTREEGGATVAAVVDESHSLSGGSTALLDRPDALPDSVVVTNASGTTTYARDVDYRVIQRGGRVEIRRLGGGTIPSGSTVLVDYSHDLREPLEYGTRDYRTGLRLDLFDHLSLYANRRSRMHDVMSGEGLRRLEDVTVMVYGASVFWPFARLTAEHEDYDSTFTPYTADQVMLDVRHRFARFHFASFNATDRRVTFEETGDENYRTFAFTYQFSVPRWPWLEVTLGTEDEDRLGFTEERKFVRVEAKYRIRATEFVLTYRGETREDDSVIEDEQYCFFSIRRTF